MGTVRRIFGRYSSAEHQLAGFDATSDIQEAITATGTSAVGRTKLRLVYATARYKFGLDPVDVGAPLPSVVPWWGKSWQWTKKSPHDGCQQSSTDSEDPHQVDIRAKGENTQTTQTTVVTFLLVVFCFTVQLLLFNPKF